MITNDWYGSRYPYFVCLVENKSRPNFYFSQSFSLHTSTFDETNLAESKGYHCFSYKRLVPTVSYIYTSVLIIFQRLFLPGQTIKYAKPVTYNTLFLLCAWPLCPQTWTHRPEYTSMSASCNIDGWLYGTQVGNGNINTPHLI